MSIFINISNHPSDKWTEEQKAAAICPKTGQQLPIVDIPFPRIDPNADKIEIVNLSYKYGERILKEIWERESRFYRMDYSSVIHIMGEMTFTYQLVQQLKGYGFIVVASTTERIVQEENPDGTKTVQFKFVKFREY